MTASISAAGLSSQSAAINRGNGSVKEASERLRQNSESSSEPQKYKSPGIVKTLLGAIVGDIFFEATCAFVPKLIDLTVSPQYIKICENITDKENASFKNAALKMLEDSGAKAKGAEFCNISKENKSVTEDLSLTIPKKLLNLVEEGKNAFYHYPSKKIIISDKTQIYAMHESGHAITHNVSKFGKVLTECRQKQGLFLAPFMLTALIKTKKEEGEKTEGFWDKTTTFIKNNIGKITFISFLPTLFDETVASLRAHSSAKKHLSPDLVAKQAKMLGWAGSTYYIAAISASLLACLSVKAKDMLIHKTPIEPTVQTDSSAKSALAAKSVNQPADTKQ
ncbi:MAG: hypothetical protein ACI4CY_04050 [Candidatus Gastranaerophilaceae bacterium]